MNSKVKVKIVNSNACIPTYESESAAGADLRSCEENIICPGETKLIRTGIVLEIPEGFEGQIRSRSGLSLKNGIHVLNSPGTIDSDYRGEVGIILHNSGNRIFNISIKDRIAQLLIKPVNQYNFIESEELSETKRGAGGYGSTGIK